MGSFASTHTAGVDMADEAESSRGADWQQQQHREQWGERERNEQAGGCTGSTRFDCTTRHSQHPSASLSFCAQPDRLIFRAETLRSDQPSEVGDTSDGFALRVLT